MDLDQMASEQRKVTLLKYDKIIYILLMAHLPITMFLIPIGYDTMGFAIGASLLVGVLASAAYFMTRGTGPLALLPPCFS